MEPNDIEPTRRFSDRAEDYARTRPDYPAAAVTALLVGLGNPQDVRVADIGAGTGILSRQLADRGAEVVAVEPNAAMRAAAAPHRGVSWLEGTSESTGLPSESLELVSVAQAFHWFSVAPTLAEFHRILAPGGRLAILWNQRSRSDEFTLGYRSALQAIGGDAPVDRSTFEPATVTASGLFVDAQTLCFEHFQPLTLEDLIGRALSTSSVPKTGPRLEALKAALRDLHARHRGADGRADMVYRTEVHLWTRSPSAR